LFFRHSPLQGEAFEKLPCMTEKREMELFGTNPVFVYDPADSSNRPVQGVHNNVIKLWPRFPRFFQDAFIHSFTQGMKNPHVRTMDNEWQKILVRLRDQWFVTCPSCGRAIFLTNTDRDKGLKCSCGSAFSYPLTLSIKEFKVPLFPGKRIYACHTAPGDDYQTGSGEVVMAKNNAALWGIKNLTQETWKWKTPAGEEKETAPDKSVPIAKGVSISFTDVEAEIKE
jgi:hypothetical protein